MSMENTMTPVKVFISYSWDSEEHKVRVLELANALREREGIDVELDQYHPHNPLPWPRWCESQIRNASFVLMICTPVYKERIEAPETNPHAGVGVCWEADYIYNELYQSKGHNEKYLSVLLEENGRESIPDRLRAYSNYTLQRPYHLCGDFRTLVDRLRGIHRTPKPPLRIAANVPPPEQFKPNLCEEPKPEIRDIPQEIDLKKELPTFLRLHFSERAIDYVRQEEVWQAFEGFYASPAPFSWWLIVGGAGSGKSRTALEFCEFLHREKQWNAGFVSIENTHPEVWHTWRPKQDTLWVVDYVARAFSKSPRDIAGIFTPLARRAQRNELGDKRIRILLLEREYKERSKVGKPFEWYRQLDKTTRFQLPFDLGTVNNEGLYRIATQTAKEIWHSPEPLPEEADFLEQLTKLDKKKRPLFAMLLAGYLAQVNPQTELSPNDVLDFAIEQEFERSLRPMGVEQTPSLLRALLLSTCTSGKLGACLLPPEHRLWESGLGTLRETNTGSRFFFHPVEPDLLGERFVLKCAGAGNRRSRRMSTQQLEEVMRTCWKLAPLETFDFFGRSVQNFASSDLEKLTELFLLTKPADKRRADILDIGRIRARCAARSEAPSDDMPTPPMEFFRAKAAVTLLNACGEAGNFSEARKLFEFMTTLGDTPQIAFLRASAAVELAVNYLHAGRAEEGKSFLRKELRKDPTWLRTFQAVLNTEKPEGGSG